MTVMATEDRHEFINGLIGLPWVKGAEGPDAFFCWGLCRHVTRELTGVELPDEDVNVDSALDVARTILRQSRDGCCWRQVDRPRDLDLVVMGGVAHAVHLGLYLAEARPGVLHSEQGAGVRFTPLRELTYSSVEFWRFVGGES